MGTVGFKDSSTSFKSAVRMGSPITLTGSGFTSTSMDDVFDILLSSEDVLEVLVRSLMEDKVVAFEKNGWMNE